MYVNILLMMVQKNLRKLLLSYDSLKFSIDTIFQLVNCLNYLKLLCKKFMYQKKKTIIFFSTSYVNILYKNNVLSKHKSGKITYYYLYEDLNI